MAIEIEAKMRLADVAGLERRLAEVGARRGPVLLEVNTFFDTPRAALKASDQGLRLRVAQAEGGGAPAITITHKGPRAHGKLKSRAETEIHVNDAGIAAQLLTNLGFAPVFSFEKRRQTWELDACAVALDRIPYLGDFVEIEGPSDTAVLAVREKLGLGAAPLIHASYISILTNHLQERGLTTQHVRFGDDEVGGR